MTGEELGGYMKYTIIFIVLCGILWIVRFVSALVELGPPTHPAYYIFAVFAVICGFLTHRLSRSNIAQRWPILVLIIFLAYTCVAIGLYNTDIEVLRQMGPSQFWYVLSILGFEGFVYIKKLRSKKELTEKEEMAESAFKGVFGLTIAFLIAIIPVLILALFAMLLS